MACGLLSSSRSHLWAKLESGSPFPDSKFMAAHRECHPRSSQTSTSIQIPTPRSAYITFFPGHPHSHASEIRNLVQTYLDGYSSSTARSQSRYREKDDGRDGRGMGIMRSCEMEIKLEREVEELFEEMGMESRGSGRVGGDGSCSAKTILPYLQT